MFGQSVRRFTWLLFGILVCVALLANQVKPKPHLVVHASQQLPDVVAPTGALATVYDEARPASVRIEARAVGMLGVPLGVGTGFFISENGLVLTAYHVVDTTEIPTSIRARTKYVAISPDKTEYNLTLIGFDAYLDLAILQADRAKNVPFLPLTTINPRVGSDIVAIGNSRDDFLQARAGRVTKIGVDRPQARFAENTIQLTAALAPGDSGGPVINTRGEAVGVVSYIAFNPEGQIDVPPYLRPFINDMPEFASYAAPVTANSDVILALKQGARRDIPVLGFSGADYDPVRSQFDLGKLPGALVQTVAAGSPAEQAGLLSAKETDSDVRADVIVAIDDQPTPSMYDLIEAVYVKGVGQTVTVTIQRGQQTFKVRLKLGAKSEVFR